MEVPKASKQGIGIARIEHYSMDLRGHGDPVRWISQSTRRQGTFKVPACNPRSPIVYLQSHWQANLPEAATHTSLKYSQLSLVKFQARLRPITFLETISTTLLVSCVRTSVME